MIWVSLVDIYCIFAVFEKDSTNFLYRCLEVDGCLVINMNLDFMMVNHIEFDMIVCCGDVENKKKNEIELIFFFSHCNGQRRAAHSRRNELSRRR
jgi:hypothetical protein